MNIITTEPYTTLICESEYYGVLCRELKALDLFSNYLIINFEFINEDNSTKSLVGTELISIQSLIDMLVKEASYHISASVRLIKLPNTPKVKSKKKKKNVSKSTRMNIYNRDKGVCQCCGKPLTFGTLDCTIDHIIPRSHGGSSTDLKNLQLLCRDCNLRKANRLISNTELYKEVKNYE